MAELTIEQKLSRMVEAEKRGILPSDKQAKLDEIRKRGLYPDIVSPSLSAQATSSMAGGAPTPPALTPDQVGITRGASAVEGDPTGFRQGLLKTASTGIRMGAETAGLVGGGIAGTTAGPAGTVGGAGVGFAAGRNLADLFDQLAGLQKPTTLREQGVRTAETALEGATYEAGGQAAGGMISAIARRSAPKIQAIKERLAASKATGVELTPAELTQGQGLAIGEGALEATPLGSGPLQAFRAKQAGQIEAAKQRIINKIGSPDYTAAEAGRRAQEAIIARSDEAYGRSRKFFEELESVVPKEAKVQVNNLRSKAIELLNQEKSVPLSHQDKGLVSLLDDLQKVDSFEFPVLKKMREKYNAIIGPKDPGISTGIKFQSSPSAGVYKQLKKALDDDIAQFAKDSGPEIKSAFDRANAFYGAQKKRFTDKMVKGLLNKDPERVIDTVFKPNNVTAINKLKRATGGEGFDIARGKFIEKLLRAEESINAPAESKLIAQLNKFDEPTLRTIFSSSELEEIRSLATVIDSAKQAARLGKNTSGTARTAFTLGTGYMAYGNPVGAGVVFVTPRMLAKVYLNPSLRKLMTRAITTELPSAEAVSLFVKLKAIENSMEKENPE